jgi:hypothetical protein
LNPESVIINNFFEKKFSELASEIGEKNTITLMYDGVLNAEIISRLENEIEERLFELNLPKSVHKRAFFISVELLQNLLIHGHKDGAGIQHQFFFIYTNSQQIKVVSANLISNVSVQNLKQLLETINSFENPADLKMFYMNKLESGEISEKGGAGLGFITISMKSGNKIKFEFLPITKDFSMFLLEATIRIHE